MHLEFDQLRRDLSNQGSSPTLTPSYSKRPYSGDKKGSKSKGGQGFDQKGGINSGKNRFKNNSKEQHCRYMNDDGDYPDSNSHEKQHS